MRLKERVQVIFNDESLTKQAFKEDCDINHIFKKWKKDGILNHVNRYQGRYEDVSSFQSYEDSLNTIARAEEAFSTLPADIRKRFDNDPGVFLEFVENPNNLDEMVKLGLAVAKPVVEESPGPSEEVKPAEDGLKST